MSRMWFDEAPDGERRMSARSSIDRLRPLGGRASTETESRYDKMRDHIDRSSDEVAWRERALDLLDAVLKSALGDDDAGAEDMDPESVARRVTDPSRSRLNALSRAPNPSRYVR